MVSLQENDLSSGGFSQVYLYVFLSNSHMGRPGILFWMGFTIENLPVAPAQTMISQSRSPLPCQLVWAIPASARQTVKQWSG